jgi:hypothetical protein
MTDLVVPSTPVLRPVDVLWDCPWDCPSLSTSDASVCSADFISQSIVSPLVLDDPAVTSSLANKSFGNIDPVYGSPLVSISSFIFRSRRSPPASLLDESLDTAAALRLEVAASLRNSSNGEFSPPAWANIDSPQGLGLGLVDDHTPLTQGTGAWTRVGYQGSSSSIVGTFGNTSEMRSFSVEVGPLANSRHPGSVC